MDAQFGAVELLIHAHDERPRGGRELPGLTPELETTLLASR